MEQIMFKFGTVGSGSENLQELINNKFIKITIKDSPNGKFDSSYIGKEF